MIFNIKICKPIKSEISILYFHSISFHKRDDNFNQYRNILTRHVFLNTKITISLEADLRFKGSWGLNPSLTLQKKKKKIPKFGSTYFSHDIPVKITLKTLNYC